ncbi:beta-hexosaminidase [Rhizoctonia solani]|uniref:Beta-hexosaminidase n=1 Tax=Rhizoctonia solani TaxID=456999 RepID=A0A8H8NVL2_9AGAM|nr:beta-hexosaminidase [Rhizoctonia solani]QRW20165.1 beta-hexosaminidase [Rhizoctonia solani]
MFSLSKLALIATLLSVNPTYALWPRPAQLSTGTTTLRLSPSFDIKLPDGAPSDLKDAVDRAKAELKGDKLERLVVGRGSGDASRIKSAQIQDEAITALGTRDEAYTLSVPADGNAAVISANSTLGLFRGLTTFTQMWYTYDSYTYTAEAPYAITDKPAYPYRGLHLDTARNYFPVADIKRTLDAMSWVKLNQFHWHIVDSQSFPLTLSKFPELAAKGAYSSKQIYSEADVKGIITYAAQRGIDVMLEIDTPGHTAIIGESHPEYIACMHKTPWATYANEPPAGQLRLANPEVRKFTADLFSALLNPLKGLGTLFSSGGDEINAKCYAEDEETQKQLQNQGLDFEGALNVFTNQTHKAIRDAGRTPVVWEEMILNHNVTLPQDTIALVWISSANVASVVNKGYRVIHAPSDFFYLDCGAGGWAYSFDPLNGTTGDQASLVMGGQSLLWTEQSDPSNLDSIVWPRAAAGAEVFWTGGNRNVTEALPRLHDIRYRMVQRGVRAIALQPEWCAVRPYACDLTA